MNRNPYVVAGVGIVVALLVAVGVVAVIPETDRLALIAEVGRAAIGVVPVAFFGVIVAELVRDRDRRNARRDEEYELRKAFRARAIGAYNESKATRRTLRGAGLRPDVSVSMTEAHLEILDDQMRRLIAAQLDLEQLKREARAPGVPFRDPRNLETMLEQIEKYLNRVIKDWERGRPGLRVGAGAEAFEEWMYYRDFVAPKEAARLPDSPTNAFKEFESAVIQELGEPGVN